MENSGIGERLRDASRRRGADPERPRRRPLLEGVRQPDRARQDAADAGDARVARRAARRRRRRTSRPASAPTSAAASRRRSPAPRRCRGARLRRRRSRSSRGCDAVGRAHRRARSRAALAARRDLGADPGRRQSTSALRAARPRARARRGRRLLRRRPRGGALPARRLPLQAVEHLDGDRAARRRRSSSPSARGSPCDSLRADILGWRSRCYRRQRDWQAAREDVERALELAESAGRPRRRRERVLPGLARRRARGPLAARARRTPSGRAATTRSWTTAANVGRLLNNLGGLNFLLGQRRAGGRAARGRATRSRSRPASERRCRPGDVLARRGSPRRPEQYAQAEEEARRALELLGGRVDYLL